MCAAVFWKAQYPSWWYYCSGFWWCSSDDWSVQRISMPTQGKSACCKKSAELPRSLWVILNRLRTGVGRFGTCLYRWDILDTPKCICGTEEQSANHIIFDCNILRPTNCLEDLWSPDINNTKWLEDLADFVWTAAHTQEVQGDAVNCDTTYDATKNQIRNHRWSQCIGRQRQTRKLHYDWKKQSTHPAMKDHSWVQMTQPVG